MAKKRFHGMYEGLTASRRQEAADSRMVSADHNAMANLPQNVIMKPFPKIDYTMNEGLDDTIWGVDQQISRDMHGGKRKKGKNPSKW